MSLRPRLVSPGVEVFDTRTPTLPPATHTNSYALGERDVLLVEPASPYEEEQRAFIEWAAGLSSQGRRARAIVLTHHHPDHVGGAEALSRALGLPLWAHEETARRLRHLAFGRFLRDGEVLDLAGPVPQRWQVLHTPGHAAGHVCLFESRAKAVVVGDMVASVGTILIDPDDGDMHQYLVELARLEDLAADTALPAHGEPIANPSALFRYYVEHRLLRENKILSALRGHGEHGATAEQILPEAYADTATAAWPFALLSIRAHLVKLERDGAVRSAGERHIAA